MTIEARINLQNGVPEDPRFEATTYNIEDDFDRYIYMHVKNRQAIEERIAYERMLAQASREIAAEAAKQIQKAIKIKK